MKCVRSHVMKMLHRYTCVHLELRDLIGVTTTLPGYFEVCNRVRTLMAEAPSPRDLGEAGELHSTPRSDEYYQCSWYLRYRQAMELNADGEEVIVQKRVFNSKENMLDLTTSFMNDGCDNNGSEAWGQDTDENGGGIFSSLFR